MAKDFKNLFNRQKDQPAPMGDNTAENLLAVKGSAGAKNGAAAPGSMRSPMLAPEARDKKGKGQPATDAARSGKDSRQLAVAPSAQNPVAAGTGHASAAAPASATAQRRAVSDIQGLNGEVVSGTSHLSHVMFDAGRGRGRKASLIVALLGVCAVAALMYLYPEYRDMAVKLLRESKDQVLDFASPSKHTKKRHQSKNHPVPTVAPDYEETVGTSAKTAAQRVGCKELVQIATGDDDLALTERVDLADCFLERDDAASAETTLEPLEAEILKASEAEINQQHVDRNLPDAYLSLISVMVREGRSRDAEMLLRNRCTKWKLTTTCVGKVLLLVQSKIGVGGSADRGMQIMFERRGALDAKAQAWLWFAGAQMAAQDGRTGAADQRISMALAAAPKGALALRKMIYEAAAVDLFHRGEVIKLKSMVSRGLEDLHSLEPTSRTKLSLLMSLATATPTTRQRTVRDLLTKEDVTYRARGDMDLIDILGPEALKAGLEEEYLRLLKRTTEFYSGKNHSLDSGIGRRLDTWQIRSLLSQQQWDGASQRLLLYDRSYGPDAVSHHLRGVALANTSQHERYQVLAAQEFQASYRLKRNWESLFALGVTLLRGGRDKAVPPLIHDLDLMVTTNGQKFWSDMLKAEFYLKRDKFLNANKILSTWISADPERWTPHELQLQLFQKTGKTNDAMQVQQVLDDLARRQRYASTFEGFASPLGYMALAKRPID